MNITDDQTNARLDPTRSTTPSFNDNISLSAIAQSNSNESNSTALPERNLFDQNDNVTERQRQRRPRDENPNNLQRQLRDIVISAATNEEDLLPFLRNLIAEECSENNQETQNQHQNLNTSHSQSAPSNDTLINDETKMNKIIYQINKANSSRTMKTFTGKRSRTKQRTDYRNFYFHSPK